MKVTINNHELTIGWSYESREINKLISKKKLTREDFKGKNKKQVCEMLGIKAYPLPEITHCIIKDEVTGDLFTGTVKRHPNDPWSREQARKRALHKAVWELFPEGGEVHNEEHSRGRWLFWNAYNNRIKKDPKAVIAKYLKNNIFTLKDLDDYVKSKETLVHAAFH